MPKAKLTRRERDKLRAAANDRAAAAWLPELPPDDMDAFRLMLARAHQHLHQQPAAALARLPGAGLPAPPRLRRAAH